VYKWVERKIQKRQRGIRGNAEDVIKLNDVDIQYLPPPPSRRVSQFTRLQPLNPPIQSAYASVLVSTDLLHITHQGLNNNIGESTNMAEAAGPILQDDLMRDRARQFVEFLDDEVCLNIPLISTKQLHTLLHSRRSL
jgi:hypothetical protein